MANDSPKLIIPGLGSLYESLNPWAYPCLRFFAGIILVPHGAQKLFGWFGGGGISGTTAFFAKVGIEPATLLAPLAGVIEFFGGILIAIGLLTRPSAFIASIFLFYAMFVWNIDKGFFVIKGGYEFVLLWAILMAYIAIRGGGEKSVDASLGKEF